MAALEEKAVVKIGMKHGKLKSDARFYQTSRQIVMHWRDFAAISVALLGLCIWKFK